MHYSGKQEKFMKPISYLILVFVFVSLACNLAAPGPAITEVPTSSTFPLPTIPDSQPATPPVSSTATPTAPDHHIGIRVIEGVGEFYLRTTGEKFIPRGMNYVRLGHQISPGGSSIFGHSLFDPGAFNSQRVIHDLSEMQASGYNVVRVFLSPDTMGTASGGFSPDYMGNIVDFLEIAAAHEIYVMFTLDWIPGGKYGEILNTDCCTTFALMNANFLPPAGLKANQVFYQDFAQELMTRNAPVQYVFSYQLRNEMFFDSNQPPLSFSSGFVTTANGETYDMGNTAEKDRMVRENLVYWIDEMRSAILQVDPTALVSVGFFQPHGPNASRIGDPRISVTEPAIWQSAADFIDLHAYPGFELNLEQYVENYGLNSMQEKPVIMGEFGGEVSRFASVTQAAQRFTRWQIESCAHGFDGWLFWTWDTQEQPDFFNAKMENGLIAQALSPALRHDPCEFGENLPQNMAAGKPVSASRALPDQPASNAVDEIFDTIWNSGAGPVQSVEIDLGGTVRVTSIRLTVSQYPEGTTIHQVWAGLDSNSLVLVHTFNGFTQDLDILDFTPPEPLSSVRVIRIVTTESPSWVAWREIEVVGWDDG